MLFPYPVNERSRLEVLRSLEIVHSEAKPEFDAVVQAAAAVFDCPIALVSLVEEEFQWFKAKCGLDADSTSREDAFCTYTILEDELTVVPDAMKDERFRENALVTGRVGIRFYAGCPLSLDGEHFLGTLCVIDRTPRTVTDKQLDQLRKLGCAVEGLIRAHHASILAKQAKKETERKSALLLQAEHVAGIGAWRMDLEGGRIEWSDQVFRIHDLPPGEPPAPDAALEFYPPTDRAFVVSKFKQAIETRHTFEFDADFVTATGRARRVRCMGQPEAGNGEPTALIGVFKDITEQHQQEQRLWRAANIDALTGLSNRSCFQSALARKLNDIRETGTELALILIDLDGFKEVNDTLGHDAGDEVLRVVAARLRDIFDEDCEIARLGGDEFAVVVTERKVRSVAVDLAHQLIRSIRQTIRHGPNDFHVGASIGIALAPFDADNLKQLLKCADIALYKVKRTGKGVIGFFSVHIAHIFDEKRHAIELVQNALLNDLVVPHYQPIVRLADGGNAGAEALVRIVDGSGELIAPGKFWPALQDIECARHLDERMLDLVLTDIVRWRERNFDVKCISLNAWTSALRSVDFAGSVREAVERYRLPSGVLRIEVVETAFYGEQTGEILSILKTFAQKGISVALDDFGTGYASLAQLRDYPFDCIKIDKSFVSNIEGNSANASIIRALLVLGHSLGITCVAEGIENQGQLEFLTALGCEYGQGMHLAPVMSGRSYERVMAGETRRATA